MTTPEVHGGFWRPAKNRPASAKGKKVKRTDLRILPRPAIISASAKGSCYVVHKIEKQGLYGNWRADLQFQEQSKDIPRTLNLSALTVDASIDMCMDICLDSSTGIGLAGEEVAELNLLAYRRQTVMAARSASSTSWRDSAVQNETVNFAKRLHRPDMRAPSFIVNRMLAIGFMRSRYHADEDAESHSYLN